MKTVVRANKRVDIKRNDTVRVISGRDKGKEGRVLRIFPNDANVKGGIAEQESRIAISNVGVMCPSCKRPVRIGHEFQGERKVRVCRKCGATLDK